MDRYFPVEHYHYIGIEGHEDLLNMAIESAKIDLIFHCNLHNQSLLIEINAFYRIYALVSHLRRT